VSARLKRAISELDLARGPFRVRGTSDGRGVEVTWIEALG
jgi:hypothetical protein